VSAIAPSGPRAQGVRWDLSRIVADAATARTLLTETLDTCDAFADRYRGTVASFDAAALEAALAELATIDNALSRIGSYAGLRRSVDMNDDEARDLEAVVDQGYVAAGNALRFFELEWIAVDDDLAAALLAAPGIAGDRHHLESLRRYRPHRLSEPEERMLSERAPAAVSAWQNLFEQTVSNVKVPFDGGDGLRDHTTDELLSYVYQPEREVRKGALEALYAALEPLTPILAHCYDSLVADRLVDDRLRSYPGPMSQRNLSNELADPAVEAMIEAIESRYDIAHRWYARKAQLLGLDKLALYDQYAPLAEGRSFSYEESRALVREAFARFAPAIERVGEAFFEERRVDAEPRQGKRGGAFCASVAQDSQAFILLNYTDRLRDVMTMAHELGHGMHFTLSAARQTPLSFHSGIALAEVPSTFAELVVFDYLMEHESDPATRAALVRGELESGFATVFRQTMMARYELDAYTMRAEGKALTPDRLAELWLARNRRQYGDAVELPDGYRWGWSYIPHFINTRFYTYAYAFAHLASLVLYAEWRREGDAFIPRYLDFLSLGGAASPGDQLAAFGIDLTQASTWHRGLDEMERLLDLALQAE
jgi:oligoendopeptidase F